MASNLSQLDYNKYHTNIVHIYVFSFNTLKCGFRQTGILPGDLHLRHLIKTHLIWKCLDHIEWDFLFYV